MEITTSANAGPHTNGGYCAVLNDWESRGIHRTILPAAPCTGLWERTFPVTDEMLASAPLYNDQFLWHRFSFEILPHDTGDSALTKFNAAAKSTLVLFHHDQEDAILLTGCDQLCAADLLQLHEFAPFPKMDIYLMPAENPTWTFVITHEPGLGPYFHRNTD